MRDSFVVVAVVAVVVVENCSAAVDFSAVVVAETDDAAVEDFDCLIDRFSSVAGHY